MDKESSTHGEGGDQAPSNLPSKRAASDRYLSSESNSASRGEGRQSVPRRKLGGYGQEHDVQSSEQTHVSTAGLQIVQQSNVELSAAMRKDRILSQIHTPQPYTIASSRGQPQHAPVFQQVNQIRPQHGLAQHGFARNGFAQHSLPPLGLPQQGLPLRGVPQHGVLPHGFAPHGFQQHALQQHTFPQHVFHATHAAGAFHSPTSHPTPQEQPTYYLHKWSETVSPLVPPTVSPWLYQLVPNKQDLIPVFGEPPPHVVVKRPLSYGINGPPDAYRSINGELVPLYRRPQQVPHLLAPPAHPVIQLPAYAESRLVPLNHGEVNARTRSSLNGDAMRHPHGGRHEAMAPAASGKPSFQMPAEQAPVAAPQYEPHPRGHKRPKLDSSVVDRQLELARRLAQTEAARSGVALELPATLDEGAMRCRAREEVPAKAFPERQPRRGRPPAPVSTSLDAHAVHHATSPRAQAPAAGRHPYENLFR